MNSPHASPGWGACQAGLPSKASSASAERAARSQQCLLRANCAPLTFGICSSTLGFLTFSCSWSHASDKDLTHEGMRLVCMTPPASLTRCLCASNDYLVISGFGHFPCTGSGSDDFSRNSTGCFCQRLLQTFQRRQLFGNILRCCRWDEGCRPHRLRSLGFAACGWGGDTTSAAASPHLVASQMTPRDCSARPGISHATSRLSMGCRGRMLFRMFCLKKHLSPQDSPTA